MVDVAMRQRAARSRSPAMTERQQHLAVLSRATVRQAAPPRLVESVRGPGGGYNLAQPPDSVSVADIIIAVDEPIDATQCGGKENCHDDRRCMTHELWAALNDADFTYLRSVTLAELVQQQHGERRRRRAAGSSAQPAGHARPSRRRCRLIATTHPAPRMKLPIYLDYSATTPVDPRVAQKMIPYLTEQFGNPASRSHAFGWTAEEAVEEARAQVAALVNCDPKEIVWTSGATESINLALKGAAHFYKDKGKHLITVKTEHKATLDTMRELEREGFEVTYLDVMPDGLLDLDAFKAALRPDTILVSVMLVNNEIGVIQDIAAIGELCRARGHHLPRRRGAGDGQGADRPRDAQGRPDVVLGAQDVRAEGHRRAVRAPQAARAHRGADARRRPRARHALGHAADAPDRRHGRGVPARAGSRWPPRTSASGCCATGCGRASREIEEVYVNGDLERRVPHNLNVSFNFVEGESADHGDQGHRGVVGLGVHVGVARAVVRAARAGRSDELAHSSIRFTVGRFTTEEEIDYAVDLLKRKVAKLRELSPLWEMYKEGVDLDTVQWAAH